MEKICDFVKMNSIFEFIQGRKDVKVMFPDKFRNVIFLFAKMRAI